MDPNIALSTYCVISKTLAEALDILENKTSAVEVMDDGNHYTNDASLLQSYPYKYTIHAPIRSVNIASILPPIRKASVGLICESMDLAAECNALRVVFHPGYYTFEEEYEKAVLALKTSLAEIMQYSRECGVPCCIENMGEFGYYFLRYPNDFSLIGDMEFCLDIGHAHQCGVLNEFLSKPFVHIHVHDNDGESDSHLGLGKGNIESEPVIAAIQKEKIQSPVVECATLDDAVETKKKLEQLLKSVDAVQS